MERQRSQERAACFLISSSKRFLKIRLPTSSPSTACELGTGKLQTPRAETQKTGGFPLLTPFKQQHRQTYPQKKKNTKKNRPSPRSEATPVTPLGRSSWLWNCLISAARSALSSAPSAASYVCESADGRWDVFLYGHVKIYTYDRCIGFFIEPKKQRL